MQSRYAHPRYPHQGGTSSSTSYSGEEGGPSRPGNRQYNAQEYDDSLADEEDDWRRDGHEDIDPSDSASATEYRDLQGRPLRPHSARPASGLRHHSIQHPRQSYGAIRAPQPPQTMSDPSVYDYYERDGYHPAAAAPPHAPYHYGRGQAVGYPQNHAGYGPPAPYGQQVVPYGFNGHPFSPASNGSGAYFERQHQYDMMPFYQGPGPQNFYGGQPAGPAHLGGGHMQPAYVYGPPPAAPPTEAPQPVTKPATPAPAPPDPAVEAMKAKLELFEKERQRKEEEERQKEMAEKIRRETEETLQRRMEEIRHAQELARIEIEKAKADAERAARERIEAERKAEEERARLHAEAMKRAEREAREKLEAEMKAAEENRKRIAEAAAEQARLHKEALERAEREARDKLEAEMKAAEERRKKEAEAAAEAARLHKEAVEKAEKAAREKYEAELKAAEEAAKKRAEEEAQRKKEQEEAVKRAEKEAREKYEAELKAAEEAAKKKAEADAAAAAAQKAQIEAAIRAAKDAEEAAAKKAAEEAELKKKIQEEAKLTAELEARTKLENERKAAEEAKAADEAAKKAKEAEKKKWQEEAKLKTEEAIRKADGMDKPPIKFKDAVGRKFSFPFYLCKTWPGMEELIKQAFLHVEVIGPRVQEGLYDLIGPDGEIILPSVWEKVIQPDWNITMHMWPMDKPQPRPPMQMGPGGVPVPMRPHPGHHPQARMGPQPGMTPGMRPANVRPAGQGPFGPPPPPGPPQFRGMPAGMGPPPGMRPGEGAPMIVQVDPGPTKKKKPANTTMLGFFAGKPSKSKKRTK